MAPALEGKVAIVTGGSRGIGAATVRALTAEGARVVVNSSRSEEAGRALAAEVPRSIYIRAEKHLYRIRASASL